VRVSEGRSAGRGDIQYCYGEIKRLERLGYQSRVCFEDGVEELVGWERTQIVCRQTAQDSFERARNELDGRGLTV
jgi:hypothetical protein